MCLLTRKAGFSPLPITIQTPYLGFARSYGPYLKYRVNNSCVLVAVHRIAGEMAQELSGFISVPQVCSAPELGCPPGSHARTFPTFPEQGAPPKSRRSPLIPYSLTFTVPVPPLPGRASNTNAALSSDFWPLWQCRCARSLGSAARPRRSHAGWGNSNVFKPIDPKQKHQQVEKGSRFQLKVPGLATCQGQVQAIAENSKLKGKYHSFAVRERRQRALSKYPSAERFAEPWGTDVPAPSSSPGSAGRRHRAAEIPPGHHSPGRTEQDKVRPQLSKLP